MGTPPVMFPSHWMPPPPMMGGPFGRHAAMWLFHFKIFSDQDCLMLGLSGINNSTGQKINLFKEA